jgi:hypothetical protein
VVASDDGGRATLIADCFVSSAVASQQESSGRGDGTVVLGTATVKSQPTFLTITEFAASHKDHDTATQPERSGGAKAPSH